MASAKNEAPGFISARTGAAAAAVVGGDAEAIVGIRRRRVPITEVVERLSQEGCPAIGR